MTLLRCVHTLINCHLLPTLKIICFKHFYPKLDYRRFREKLRNNALSKFVVD